MARLEETRMELGGQLTYLKLMLMGTWSLSKLLVTSAGDVKKLRQTRPSEDHYVRPPRRYELPPYTDGMEVCRFIKRDPIAEKIMVVFVTAEDDPSIKKKAHEAGASDYLVKPVDVDRLESILDKLPKSKTKT